MTEPAADVVRQFVQALPGSVRAQLHRTQLVDGMVHAAIRDHGWTIAQLAAECSRDIAQDHANAGALVTYRLRHCAGHPPASVALGAAGRPFCSDQCKANAGWHLSPDTLLPIERCECRRSAS